MYTKRGLKTVPTWPLYMNRCIFSRPQSYGKASIGVGIVAPVDPHNLYRVFSLILAADYIGGVHETKNYNLVGHYFSVAERGYYVIYNQVQ